MKRWTLLVGALFVMGLACAHTDNGDDDDDDSTSTPTGTESASPSPTTPLNAAVSIPSGTSVPGCEETDECWDPATATILQNGTITWTNDDAAMHTITSGDPSNGADGVFDSSLIAAATMYEFTFLLDGTYPYFCMIHPWQQGTIVVEPAPPQSAR